MIDPAAGSFIGWGDNPNQAVKGYVTTVTTSKDYNDNPCPELGIELTEATFSVTKEGVVTNLPAGDDVAVTCGQTALKRRVEAARLNPGDYVEITMTGREKAANGMMFKQFTVGIDRGARPPKDAPTQVTAPANPWAAPAPAAAPAPPAPPAPPAAPPAPTAPAPAQVQPTVPPAGAAVGAGPDPMAQVKQLIGLGLTDDVIATQLGLDPTVIAICRTQI